jgi:hypothetical protein
MPPSNWRVSYRADPLAAALADRHYSRRRIGARQFAPPGRALVLVTHNADALFVMSHQRPEFTRHAFPGAWVCSLFRNESHTLSSRLITDALAVTRFLFGPVPTAGVITFVDPRQVKQKRHPGFCFRRVGFREVGRTRRGLIVLRLTPPELPPAHPPAHLQRRLPLLS